jgi:hypothetical protein
LEGKAFGVLKTAFFGEVEGSCPGSSEGSTFVSYKEQTVSVKGEIQRLIGTLQLSLCLEMR